MLARLLDAGLREPPTLRTAMLGGGPVDPALLRRAHEAGVPVAASYGLTEACSAVAIGRPIPGVTVEIAPDGEILVSGPTVAPSAQPLLHTGDLGTLDLDGSLRVIGRKADTIVTGGENVAPQEVEAVLLSHPAIADAAVYPVPDPEWGEAVVASVVKRAGAAVPADDELEDVLRRAARAVQDPQALRVDRIAAPQRGGEAAAQRTGASHRSNRPPRGLVWPSCAPRSRWP